MNSKTFQTFNQVKKGEKIQSKWNKTNYNFKININRQKNLFNYLKNKFHCLSSISVIISIITYL